MTQPKTLNVNDCNKLRALKEGDVVNLHFNFTASLTFHGDLPIFIVRNGDGTKTWRRGTLNACYAKAWEYTSTETGLSYKALQDALLAESGAQVDDPPFTGRYVVVCESDGCETYFYADDALIVPVDELSQDRIEDLVNGESKVFKHGEPFPHLPLSDLLAEAENYSEVFMRASQGWAISKGKGDY